MDNNSNIIINNGPGYAFGQVNGNVNIQPQPLLPTDRFDVPEARNRRFVDRQEVFERLEECMHNNNQEIGAALVGLGGMGKTQIALEYCYRNRPVYQYIFWVKAESENSMQSSFEKMARLLNLPINSTDKL